MMRFVRPILESGKVSAFLMFTQIKLSKTRCMARAGHVVMAILMLMSSSLVVQSQDAANEADAAATDSDDQSKIPISDVAAKAIGINGHYRIGYWTAIRTDAGADVSVETVDGDGASVVYHKSVSVQKQTSGPRFHYVVPSVEAASLVVRDGDQTVLEEQFPMIGSPSRGPAAIPADMKWVVCLGDPMGIEKLGANELLRRDAMIAVSNPKDASVLPDHPLGYDGVNLVVINGSGAEVLKGMTPAQSTAMVGAIRSGLRCFLTLGKSTPKTVEAAPWLIDMLPVPGNLEVRRIDPVALETYTNTQSPLVEFDGALLPADVGKTVLRGRTNRRESTPIVVDYQVGFGVVTVVAADLDAGQFGTWSDRMDLVKRLTGGVLEIKTKGQDEAGGMTSFDDLAGQARASLDQFPIKRQFGFSFLSLILMGLIAIIGPLDYLLINRVFGRPLLGWLSFPLVVIGISVLLVTQSKPNLAGPINENGSTPDSLVRCNQMEFVDIDTISNLGTGFSWSQLYTHEANQFQVSVEPSKPMQAISKSVSQVRVAPFGVADKTFGGIPLASLGKSLPSYSMKGHWSDGVFRSQIEGLSIAPRSSKSLAARLTFQPKLQQDVRVQRRYGSDDLEGSLANPLPNDLLDGMLVYGNLVYMLPSRFVVGGRVDSLRALNPRTFSWLLARQVGGEKSSVEREDWEPDNFKSPSRVAELLMFYKAGGGKRYTGLNSRPLSFLDLSSVLKDQNRCILMGHVDVPWLDVKLNDSEGESIADPTNLIGQTHSFVRVVLPVDSNDKRRSRNR